MPDDHADLHAVAAALAATPKARLTPKRTANALRRFVRARGALTFTSVEDDPERFFGAHRALATHATTLGPGFWIRFTVQYNLFAGTCAALGTEAQRARLEALRLDGKLGCFCLTERLAGVNSGLVVNTRADWDEKTGGYAINSGEGDGGTKNWISQGSTADHGGRRRELVRQGSISRTARVFGDDARGCVRAIGARDHRRRYGPENDRQRSGQRVGAIRRLSRARGVVIG